MSSVIAPPWYAISGGPSSGKTTTVELLRSQGHRVSPEVARSIITEQMALGRTLVEIRADGENFQRMILERQIEFEAGFATDEVVFLDRGIPDGLGYERFLNLEPYEPITVASRNARYRRVFVLDNLHLHDDGSRIEDEDEQQGIHDHIVAVYTELGHDVVTVPVMSPEDRVAFILANL